MIGFWFRTLLAMLGSAAVALVFAAIGGASSGWNVAVLILGWWLVYHLFYLRRMMQWMEDFRLEKVPHGSGIWDLLFSKVYRVERAREQQRQELAEALKDFRNATEAMPEGVVTLDEENHVIYANEQAEDQLGISSVKDTGRNLINIVRHPDFVAYINGSAWEKSITVRGIRDSDRVLQIQLIPYGTRQRLLMTRDITQLDRLETTRRDFVANVSHELKTPLTVLNGFLETIRELPVTEEQRQHYLGLMQGQAHRMQNIVDDLLVLSKLESTTSTTQEEPITMRPIIDRLVADAVNISRGQHQIIVASIAEATLLGAEDELVSAFSNLVSNAVRYTPEQGTITLDWGIDARGQGVFSVQDTGPGIASQHLPRLTERFYRVDRSRSRETGGTGLGLAIVKHVATRHQAQLVIDSEVGKGSRFSIAFPAKRIQPPSD